MGSKTLAKPSKNRPTPANTLKCNIREEYNRMYVGEKEMGLAG
jgi:hypothetical protein